MGDETEPGIGADAPTTMHAPTPGPDVPLAYSETVDLPEPRRRSRAPAALFITAVAALAAAVAGWFLIRPSTTAEKAPAPATTASASAPVPHLSASAPAPLPASRP